MIWEAQFMDLFYLRHPILFLEVSITDILLFRLTQLYVFYLRISTCFGLNRPSSGPRHNTGLFEMIVGILTTCHTQYT